MHKPVSIEYWKHNVAAAIEQAWQHSAAYMTEKYCCILLFATSGQEMKQVYSFNPAALHFVQGALTGQGLNAECGIFLDEG